MFRRFVHREGDEARPKHPMQMLASLTVGNMMKASSGILNPGPLLAALPEKHPTTSEIISKHPETSIGYTVKNPRSEQESRKDNDYQNETLIEFENSPDIDGTRVCIKTLDKVSTRLPLSHH